MEAKYNVNFGVSYFIIFKFLSLKRLVKISNFETTVWNRGYFWNIISFNIQVYFARLDYLYRGNENESFKVFSVIDSMVIADFLAD